MEHFPKPLERAESDALVARIREHFSQRGFGLRAVEVPGVAGFVGLSVPRFETHFTPCVEVGWRLAPELMERLGMTRSPGDDFENPSLAVGHPMRPHVLYRLRRDEWRNRNDRR